MKQIAIYTKLQYLPHYSSGFAVEIEQDNTTTGPDGKERFCVEQKKGNAKPKILGQQVIFIQLKQIKTKDRTEYTTQFTYIYSAFHKLLTNRFQG